MLFRPKDRKYTAKEVQKKADGYAMAYIKSFKEKIEQSFEDVKNSVTNTINNFSGKIDSFIETLNGYFDLENGEFYKLKKEIEDDHEAFKIEIEEELAENDDAVSSVNGKTGDVNLTASDVGACTPKDVDDITGNLIVEALNEGVFPKINTKAESDLSNISDEVFFAKLNAVLPDGDEVSY